MTKTSSSNFLARDAIELNGTGNDNNSDQHQTPFSDSKNYHKIPSILDEKEVSSSIKSSSAGMAAPTPSEPENEKDQAPAQDVEVDTHVYPTGLKLVFIMASLFMAMFLVALDRTIVATATPRITDEFNSLGDVGWYGSAYMLTSCSFQLFFGKIYTFYNTKWTFLIAIGFFELGSALCGASPNSISIIIGRAIQGFGAAGIFSGVITVMVGSVPLHKRPAYQGGFGAVFGLASVVGPLLGGALTTKATWRWCFYMNLPIGAVSALVIAFILKLDPPRQTGKTLKEQAAQLDPIGTLFFLPGIVCLLLALQWGGSTYAWNSGRIIALLVLAGILLIGFINVQMWKQDGAMVPPRIIKQRSIASGFSYAMLAGSAMMIFIYFVPIWFQAILGVSAINSGVKMLPLVLSLIVGSAASGGVTFGLGYYTPGLILGTCIMSVGAGLLSTFNLNTSTGQWVGYQILFGFGLGCSMQIPGMAAQTVLTNADVPIGASLMFFAQWLGGAIFVSVGQNVLSNKLVQGFKEIGIDAGIATHYGATDLRKVVPPELLHRVLVIFNNSLTRVFVVALALACASIIPAATMEWKSVKKNKPKKGAKKEDIEVQKSQDAEDQPDDHQQASR